MSSCRTLIKGIFVWATRIAALFPLRYIVFESIPDYSDNTRAVFDEMVRRGLNSKYRFVWLCKSKKTNIPIKGVILSKCRGAELYFRMRAKCLISCNWFIPSFNQSQKSVYLCHGVPLKSLNSYRAPDHLDYVIGLSDETNKIQSKELGIDLDKFISLGYPRNDALYVKRHHDIEKIFGNNYRKFIVWYPTYRQHGIANISADSSHAIPIIYNESNAIKINNIARSNGVLIILKPHFSQDMSFITDLNLSNILLIKDSFFAENQMTSYEFVGGCDALITDYSSIYFDYLLINKPIAAIWEDIDEYRNSRGFAIDVDYYMKGAYKVYSVDDFICFINSVATGKDEMKIARNEIINSIHKNIDNLSSARVVDFIEKEILLKNRNE